MSLATFALAQTALAQPTATNAQNGKSPPKRTLTALTDPTLVPEPR